MKKFLIPILIITIFLGGVLVPIGFKFDSQNKIAVEKNIAWAFLADITDITVSETGASAVITGEFTTAPRSYFVKVRNTTTNDEKKYPLSVTNLKFLITVTLTQGQSYEADVWQVDNAQGGASRASHSVQFEAVYSTPEEKATQRANNFIGDELDCGYTTIFTDCLVLGLYNIVYVPSSWILAGGGKIFDVFASISLDSRMYGDSTFVEEGWKIVRDIANIFFIFGLLWIAINIILGLSSQVNPKKLLPTLIIVALLINFSLFFSKVIIDSSNIIAKIFYNRIEVTGAVGDSFTSAGEQSLSLGITKGLGVQKIFSPETIEALKADPKMNTDGDISLGALALIIILGIFVNLSAAWTLIIAGVLFLSRILSLWIVMIFSPLAFASYAVPGISSMMEEVGHQKWWTNLINLSFLAPIFIFFIYLIILMINSDFLSGLLNTGGDFTYIMVIILLQFLFILFLLKMAKQTAEKLAGEMGSTFVKAAKAVGGVALGAATGGAALMGRASLGRVGSMLAKSERLKRFASGTDKEGNEVKRGAFGKLAQFGAKGLRKTSIASAKGSWDIRRTAVGGELSKQTGLNLDNKIVSGVGLGTKTTTGGWTEATKRKAQKIKEEQKSYGMGKGAATGQDKKVSQWKNEKQSTDDAREEEKKEKKDKYEEEYNKAREEEKRDVVYDPDREYNEEEFRKKYESEHGKADSWEEKDEEQFKQKYETGGKTYIGETSARPKTSKEINEARRESFTKQQTGDIYDKSGKIIPGKAFKEFGKDLIKETLKGMALGAAVGTVIPGAGTMVGGAFGAGAGFLKGLKDLLINPSGREREVIDALESEDSDSKKILDDLKKKIKEEEKEKKEEKEEKEKKEEKEENNKNENIN